MQNSRSIKVQSECQKINPSGPFGHLLLFYIIPNHFILGGVQGWDVIHGGMKLASWIFSGVRNSVPKLGSNKNTQQPIFHVLRGTFYLTSSSPLRRGITWRLQEAPDPQLLSLRLWLVNDVQWTQSCYWVDKLLAPYTHLHNAYLSILMRKNYHRPIGTFWSTTNTTSPTFRLSVASLHFLWVLSVARNSSLQCLQNSFTR